MTPKSIAYALLLQLLASNIYSQIPKNTIYGGTSIVMVYSKDSVWIAADSKGSHGEKSGNDQTKITDRCVCKIVEVNNVISASSGHFAIDYSNNVIVYSVTTETKKAILAGINIKDAINIFSDTTVTYLTKVIRDFRKENDTAFNVYFNGDDLISSVFTSFVNGSRYVALLEFKLVGNPDNWHVEAILKEYKSEESGYIFMGYKDSITKFYNKNPNYFASNDLMENKLKYLIKLEIAERPDKVGKPIDVIVLYRNGFRWLPKKRKGC